MKNKDNNSINNSSNSLVFGRWPQTKSFSLGPYWHSLSTRNSNYLKIILHHRKWRKYFFQWFVRRRHRRKVNKGIGHAGEVQSLFSFGYFYLGNHAMLIQAVSFTIKTLLSLYLRADRPTKVLKCFTLFVYLWLSTEENFLLTARKFSIDCVCVLTIKFWLRCSLIEAWVTN